MSSPRHVVRGLFSRKRERRVIWVGNSLHQPTTTRNTLQNIVSQSPVGIKGGVTGIQSTVGMPTGIVDLPSVSMTYTGIRPGELSPAGASGFNLRATTIAAGDMDNFGFPIAIRTNGTWDENRSVRVGILAISDPTATGYLVSPGPNLQVRNRAGAWSSALDYILSPISFQQSPATYIARQTTFHPVGTGGQGQRVGLQGWSGTQTGELRIGGMSIESNSPEGLFLSYCGNGGWGSTHHASQTGAVITADPPTYTAQYNDAALIAEYGLWRYNQVVVDVTANDTTTPTATLRANLAAIRARHWAAADAAGVPRPDVLFWTQYDLSDTTSLFNTMADVAYDLAIRDSKTECFDFCRLKRAVSGLYSTWQAVELVDGVHPATANAILRTQMATTFYSIMNQINTRNRNAPLWLRTPPVSA
jgi:hypothetical protein